MRARAEEDDRCLMRLGLASLLVAAGCASFVARDPAPLRSRQVRLDHGITLPVAPLLLTLPEIATFRFVAPDSLALGLTAEDATSVGLREPRELREAVGTVLLGLGWEVIPDSAAFELALFMTARTVRRTEQRTESYPDPNATLPRCGYTREDRPGVNCTKDPNPVRTVNVPVVDVERRLMLVLRRRVDGAHHWWSYAPADLEGVKAAVARDLLRMRLTPAP